MRNLFTFTFFVFAVYGSFAQTKTGKIIYKVEINGKPYIDLISTENTPDSEEIIIEHRKDAISKAKPINYFLCFNGSESVFLPEYNLAESRRLGIQWNWTSFATKSYFNYYSNITKNETFGQSYFTDRVNVLFDKIHWEITQETKQIGNYICYKATGLNSNKKEFGFNHLKPAVAWFTPQIPVPFGIQEFSGLPGLVLEMEMFIEYGTVHYVATSIELNVEIDQKIENNKGKVINEQEYFELLTELNAGR